jgi:hypothetical protein
MVADTCDQRTFDLNIWGVMTFQPPHLKLFSLLNDDLASALHHDRVRLILSFMIVELLNF